MPPFHPDTVPKAANNGIKILKMLNAFFKFNNTIKAYKPTNIKQLGWRDSRSSQELHQMKKKSLHLLAECNN